MSCIGGVDGLKAPCYSKKECPGNLGHQNDGSTEPCTCDGAGGKFFDVCDDPCNNDGLDANGGVCGAASYFPEGYYVVRKKCTTLTGEVINYLGQCFAIDCEGNRGPCYGKQKCSSGTIAVDPCECGGVTYGSSCVVECPYEDTAADCGSGQTFTQRCKDNNGTWYGECK